MKYILLLILSFSLVSVSCTRFSKARNIADIETPRSIYSDEIQSQDFVDSVFKTFGDNPDKDWSIFLKELKGNVESVVYNECIFFPYQTEFLFDIFGNIVHTRCYDKDERYINVKRDYEGVDPHEIRYYFNTIGGLEFSNSLKCRIPEISLYDYLGRNNFTIHYNTTGDLYKIDETCVSTDEYEGIEYDTIYTSYNVVINKIDEHGNWTSMTLKSQDKSQEEQTITRQITYYSNLENNPPQLIKTTSKNTVYCYYPAQYEGYNLFYFDTVYNSWRQLLPPDYKELEGVMLTYKDFRVVGEHLYLIFITNAAGRIAQNCYCDIYDYNVLNKSWKRLALGAEGCEFVGDKIKVVSYEVIEDENDNVNDTGYEIIDDDNDDNEEIGFPHYEYREVVEWIQMK